MISWWSIDIDEPQTFTSHPSIVNFFFKKEEIIKNAKDVLKLVKYLNEPDRTIDRIVCSKGSLCLLEDSTHGRLLLLETELGLILKVFKGHRYTSASFTGDENELILWSGNRFLLEKWINPLNDSTRSLIQEYPKSVASFSFGGDHSFFVYSNESHQLNMFI